MLNLKKERKKNSKMNYFYNKNCKKKNLKRNNNY